MYFNNIFLYDSYQALNGKHDIQQQKVLRFYNSPYYKTNQQKNINTAKPPWKTKNGEPLLTISLKKKNHH